MVLIHLFLTTEGTPCISLFPFFLYNSEHRKHTKCLISINANLGYQNLKVSMEITSLVRILASWQLRVAVK